MRRIDAPPALEAPEALLPDAQSRNTAARATRVAGLEIKEALEHRFRPGAVGLALAAVEEDETGRPRSQLVPCALRPPVSAPR